MSFKNAVQNTPVMVDNHNGGLAYRDTLNANVDLFFKIGASRGKNIIEDFELAYLENRDLALRIAQWARDVRSGAGERKLFRDILVYLETHRKLDLLDTNLLNNVVELGRWDDLLIFNDPEVKAKAYSLIAAALNEGHGLCAKWMPRKGPVAADLRKFLGWTPKFYRKRLVELTKVVETQMCAKNWNEINFSHVPSLAMSRYSKAFGRNAPDAFAAYKAALSKADPEDKNAEVKINAGAVYPYDIAVNILRGDSKLADEQWKRLPNYVGESKILPMVDLSESMFHWDYYSSRNKKQIVSASPYQVAISLGVYCAEKNKGAFEGLVLSFTDQADIIVTRGSASQRIKQVANGRKGYSTNLSAAFEKILNVALKNSVPQEDMPEALLILSDMQFNPSYVGGSSVTALAECRSKFEAAGYKMPAIVFWNLNAHDSAPAKKDDKGVALVSGFSPSIMKTVLSADFDSMTPEGIMKKTVLVDRYNYER